MYFYITIRRADAVDIHRFPVWRGLLPLRRMTQESIVRAEVSGDWQRRPLFVETRGFLDHTL